MDPQDSRSPSPWAWGFLPGDRVRVLGGSFVGMTGEVLTHEQAEERLRTPERRSLRPTADEVWVLIELFGRPVPVQLMPDQIEAAGPEGVP